ncbi:hypothetical protein LRS10_02055 [Phenylobacterium sp. J426]|uniref:hypothetical protein n=1 Tax=Phenylobacterium sp. J426 TaxID=2898439 RepID=UPI002150855D|nr:hypothetical protein [Phenylobacterium sp. J426]MCR5873085.1 hypothetical protein [Phenylobacterium sp. J426]
MSPAAVFDTEMLAGLPASAGEGTWLLIRHPDFTLKLSAGAATFNTTASFDSTPRTLRAWIQLLRGLGYLARGDGVIVLTPSMSVAAAVTLPMSSRLDGPYLQLLPAWSRALEAWERLLALAGVPPGGAFSLQDLWEARGVALAADLSSDAPHRLVRLRQTRHRRAGRARERHLHQHGQPGRSVGQLRAQCDAQGRRGPH